VTIGGGDSTQGGGRDPSVFGSRRWPASTITHPCIIRHIIDLEDRDESPDLAIYWLTLEDRDESPDLVPEKPLDHSWNPAGSCTTRSETNEYPRTGQFTLYSKGR
jgi:hypothetical protein